MNATSWLALAAASCLLRLPDRAAGRVALLAAEGRLAGVASRPGRVRRGSVRQGVAVCLVAAVGLVLVTGGPLLATAVAAACAVGWLLRLDARRRTERAARESELGAAVRVLIGELEAGSRPGAALAAAGVVAPRHAGVLAEAAAAATGAGDAGRPLVADPDTRTVGLAWQIAEDTGLALAGVLGRVADDLRAEQDQRRAVDAALAGPRASALLLSGLPIVGVALGTAMGARPLSVLTGTAAGRALCCAGVLLDAVGLLWMRRIIARAEHV